MLRCSHFSAKIVPLIQGEVWFLHALESYFDLLALPFALALLLAPWRCTSLHTEDLKRTLSHRNTCGEQLSAIRRWALLWRTWNKKNKDQTEKD